MRHPTLVVMLGLGLAASTACAPRQQAPVNPQAQVLADFTTRINQYVEMRKKADNGTPSLGQTSQGSSIQMTQEALQKQLIAARPGAKHGDIFTPEISTRFRSLLRPEVRERQTRESVASDNPGNVTYKVMAPYPENEPLSTVPPNVLASLPQLPADIEYRFVGKHLILRDARANLIIDYLANAIA